MNNTSNECLEQLRQRFVTSFNQHNKEFNLRDFSEYDNTDTISFFEQLFTQGLCVNFQEGALNHLQNWKQWVILFGEEEYSSGQHMVLKHPTENVFLDVLGLRSLDDILETYNAQNANYIWHGDGDNCSSFIIDETVMEDIALFFIKKFNVNEYTPKKRLV